MVGDSLNKYVNALSMKVALFSHRMAPTQKGYIRHCGKPKQTECLTPVHFNFRPFNGHHLADVLVCNAFLLLV